MRAEGQGRGIDEVGVAEGSRGKEVGEDEGG